MDPSNDAVRLRILSWNLYHGRDRPPEPELFTLRSRLLGATERGLRYDQVNRPLLAEFGRVLARDNWTLALLQETPPRWLRPLAEVTGATAAIALTSRNCAGAVRGALADRNPDLVAFQEGGSNQLLARPPLRIVRVRRATLRRLPERRRLLFAVLRGDGVELALANLHADFRRRQAAERDVRRAAELAIEWADGLPLVLGGDLNLRAGTSERLFDELDRAGLEGPSPHPAIDHLLVRGAQAAPAVTLASTWRELTDADGCRLRLSDHPALAREVLLRRAGGR